MILTEPYIDFLIEHNLTQGEYLLLQLLYEERGDLIRKYKKAFPIEESSMIPSYFINSLVQKGFLVKIGKHYKLGEVFLKVFVTPDVAVDEIYDIYPAFLVTDKGIDIPLLSMDRRIFREIYIPKIFGNITEHKEVIKDIKYGIDNNKIKMGINNFLTSEQWKILRKERLLIQVKPITEDEETF